MTTHPRNTASQARNDSSSRVTPSRVTKYLQCPSALSLLIKQRKSVACDVCSFGKLHYGDQCLNIVALASYAAKIAVDKKHLESKLASLLKSDVFSAQSMYKPKRGIDVA